jgi:hypothetical protein
MRNKLASDQLYSVDKHLSVSVIVRGCCTYIRLCTTSRPMHRWIRWKRQSEWWSDRRSSNCCTVCPYHSSLAEVDRWFGRTELFIVSGVWGRGLRSVWPWGNSRSRSFWGPLSNTTLLSLPWERPEHSHPPVTVPLPCGIPATGKW